MPKSDPKELIKALSRTSRTALEAAVGRCITARNHEVTVEHLLLGLLDDRGSDVSLLVGLHGFEPGSVPRALDRLCADLRTGNDGRPTFSPFLLQLLEDALHGATLPGAPARAVTMGPQPAPNPGALARAKIRSADLFEALLRDPSRYGAAPLVDRLRKLPRHAGPLASMPLGDLAKEGREAAGPPLEAPVPRRPRALVVHRVLEGESLLEIARRYALDLEEVARANRVGITDPLRVGSTLELQVLSELVWPVTTMGATPGPPAPAPPRDAEVVPIRRPASDRPRDE